MRNVSIIGIGQTRVGEHWDRSLGELIGEAVRGAIASAGVDKIDALYVGNMLSGRLTGQEQLGALAAGAAGLGGIEAIKVEAACGSGGAAFRQGFAAVAGGLADFVVVCGGEKMTDQPGPSVTAALAMASDSDYEAQNGLSFVALNALLMRRYMYQYRIKHEEFASFAINAHRNAVNNPFAMFSSPITLENFKNARMIADPVNLLDSSPVCDGAAAIVLCPAEMAYNFCKKPVAVRASVLTTDTVALHDRKALLALEAVSSGAARAYSQAGLGPKDIDLFELHDAFTIISALSLEACGFAERGHGVRLALDGAISIDGKIPISTMGGLKARGHPVGATGIYQLVELATQMRGEAGKNQVRNAHVGMAQNIGGCGTSVVTTILESP